MLDHPRETGRWLALYAVCAGILMTVLDTTIVTVALPSLVVDLRIKNSSLTWIINAYTLTFGGSILLSGRLSDLYGPRRLFLVGIVIFTLASLGCGLAYTETALLIARAAQGLGGAAVTAVGLSLITNLFPDPKERARALGMYGLVTTAGGIIGQPLGGLLSELLSWHWIFLANLPIGVAAYALCMALLPRDRLRLSGKRQLDIGGALTVTFASSVGTFMLVDAGVQGWVSAKTAVLLALTTILVLGFIAIEARVPEPLVPMRLLRTRNFAMANIVAALRTAGGLAWLVIATLYLEEVLGYDQFHAGLAFAPASIISAVFSGAFSGRIATRFGIRRPLLLGLLLSTVGLALLARAPQCGTFVVDILPAMVLVGLGGGIAATPFLLLAMNDVRSEDSGLAASVLNMSFLLGGALGLATLTNLADSRTQSLRRSGTQAAAALSSGYHFALLIGALFSATAAFITALALRPGSRALELHEPDTADSGQPDVAHRHVRIPE